MFDRPQLDVLAEFQSDGRKRPFQAWPVQQNVWPGIKRKPLIHISRSQASSLGARFQHLNAKSFPRQPQCSG
jgi:hypothetical protein